MPNPNSNQMVKNQPNRFCLTLAPSLSLPPPLLCPPAAGGTGRLPTAPGSRAPGADRGVPASAPPAFDFVVVVRIPTPRTGGAFSGVLRLPAAGAGHPVLHADRTHPVACADGGAPEGDTGGQATAASVAAYAGAIHGAAPYVQLAPTG